MTEHGNAQEREFKPLDDTTQDWELIAQGIDRAYTAPRLPSLVTAAMDRVAPLQDRAEAARDALGALQDLPPLEAEYGPLVAALRRGAGMTSGTNGSMRI